MNEQDKKEVEFIAKQVLRKDFSKRIGDTPTDNLQLTPRGYINLSGTTALRPNSSIASLGQQYFSTTLGKPIFFNGTNWVDATSSVVAG